MEKKEITIIDTLSQVMGFKADGIAAGIKKTNALDLGIVIADSPCTTIAVYTTNKVKGAPLIICKQHLSNNEAQCIIVNSGVANTCTGQQGLDNAINTCKGVATHFSLPDDSILPLSTGVIGTHLPMEKIISGISKLHPTATKKGSDNFSRAIMTTDTVPKMYGKTISTDKGSYSIYGTAKGSGMIAPNMATMLAFFFTDAPIETTLLEKAFRYAIDRSLNAITIDGDTSTNDTALIMSSHLAEYPEINNEASSEFLLFQETLLDVCCEIAQKIVIDGEGATKLIEIEVKDCPDVTDAKLIAKSVAESNLVKTAFFGEDANWGRILCAAGYSNATFIPEKADVYIQGILVFEKGTPLSFDEKKAKNDLQNNLIKVIIQCNNGNHSWKMWTSDLSYDYVKINASYRT